MPRRILPALGILLVVMALGLPQLAGAIPLDQVQQWPFASVFQLPIEAQRGITVGTTTNNPNPTNMLDVTGSAAVSGAVSTGPLTAATSVTTNAVTAASAAVSGAASTGSLSVGVASTAVPAPIVSVYSKSATWTVPTMIATPVAVTAAATVTVPGAVVGDNAVASYGPFTSAGGTPVTGSVVVAGQIIATDTCRVTITNLTGAVLALDAGTARCSVIRY